MLLRGTDEGPPASRLHCPAPVLRVACTAQHLSCEPFTCGFGCWAWQCGWLAFIAGEWSALGMRYCSVPTGLPGLIRLLCSLDSSTGWLIQAPAREE